MFPFSLIYINFTKKAIVLTIFKDTSFTVNSTVNEDMMYMDFIRELSPIMQGLLSGIFTWSVTALGAAAVFLFKKFSQKALDCMLGFGAGVMTAASFWSLLSPAIELSERLYSNAWIFPALGFALGGAFVILTDILFGKFTFESLAKNCKSGKNGAKRSILLILAVTAHNIPEGMAVGVAFGVAAIGAQGYTVASALMLALGIGLQNFPEGAAVSLPLRREGFSRGKSFFFGQLSGAVEPLGAMLGVAASLTMQSLLPLLLSFSAGAMIGVVALELIPESVARSKAAAATGLIAGFLIMMILDVALG